MALRERFTKALRKKADRGFSGYPIATLAFYGPNDMFSTKVAVGIFLAQGEEPAFLERWFSQDRDVRNDHDVNERILKFIRTREVKSVVMTHGIIGCPHEEGVDYPHGSTCPQCPFWVNRDRWGSEVVQ